MILLVTGGRELTLRPYDWLRLDAFHVPVKMLFGGDVMAADRHRRYEPGPVHALYNGKCTGADTCARAWAESRGVPYRDFPYDRSKGRAGGPARNASMLAAARREAEHLETELVGVAFPGGDGTANMVEQLDAAGVRILDYRQPPVQRWNAADVRRVEDLAEAGEADDLPAQDAWERAIMQRWAERGADGVPLCSAHLWTRQGRVQLPPHGALYIGRHDHRSNIPAGLLANPFPKAEGPDAATLLGRYQDHLRDAYRGDVKIRELLLSLKPWTLLICWCHENSPCHGTIVADAALQAQAAAEIKAAGRTLPAKHWSAYRGEEI